MREVPRPGRSVVRYVISKVHERRSIKGQAEEYLAAGDAAANIFVMHPGTGSHDAPHWSVVHNSDGCLQNV